jgi:tape measure domain-containing protein
MAEEVGNLLVRVGLDGSGFQQGISSLNRQMKIVQTEFQAAAAALGDFGDSTEKLKLKADSLAKQIDIQRQKVEAYEKALQESIAKSEEHGQKALEVKNKLDAMKAAFEEVSQASGKNSEEAKKLQAIKQGFDAVIGGGIQFNANMQENEIAFTQMLGSAEKAKAMLQDLTQFAATTPFELPQVEDAAKKLLAFGFSAEQVKPMLTAIGDAAAGLGLGAAGIDRITLALGQMYAKGKVQGDEMLQLVEAGIPAWDILAKAMGVSTAQLQKMVSDGVVPADKAIQALVAGMEQHFPHMMDAQSKSFTGLMSNLKDNLSQAFGQIMKPTFDWLTNVALPKAVQLTTNFTQALKAGGMSEALKTIMPSGVVDGLIALGNAVKEVFGFISQHTEAVKAALMGIGAAFAVHQVTGWVNAIKEAGGAIGILTNAFKALSGTMLANPWALAIGALVTAAVAIYQHWDQIKAFLINSWNAIKTTAENVFNGLGAFFSGVWNGLTGSLMNVWTTISTAISNVWNGIATAVSNVWNTISATASSAWNGIVSIIQSAWTGITGVIQSVWATIGPIVQAGIDNLKTVFTAGFQTIGAVISAAWETIKTIFAAAFLVIYDLLTGQWDQIGTVIKAAWNRIGSIISGMLDNIRSIWSSAFSTISSNTSAAWERIKSIFSSAWSGLVSVVTSLWNSIKSAFISAGQAIASTVSSMWNSIVSFFASAPGRIVGLVSSLWASVRAAFSSAIQTVISIVVSMWNSIVSFFASAPSRIVSALSGLRSALVGIWNTITSDAVAMGRNIIEGLINGVKSMASMAVSAVKGVVNDAVQAAKNLLGIHSPSRVFMEFGQYVDEGLAIGIDQNKDKPVSAADKMAKAVQDAAKKVLDELSLSMQISQARFDLLNARMADTASESQKLTAQLNSLQEQLSIQNDKVALLQKAYDEMRKAKGADVQETQNLLLQLLQEQKAQADLENKIKETTKALQGQADTLQSVIDKLNLKAQIEKATFELTKTQMQNVSNQLEQLIVEYAEQNAQLQIENEKVRALSDAYEKMKQEKGETADETKKLYLQLLEEQKAQADLVNQIESTNKAIEDQKKQLQDLADEARRVQSTYQAQLAQAAEEYYQKVEELNKKVAADTQKAIDDFNKSLEQKAQQLRDFVGLFDEIKPEKVSGAQLLKNLQDQVNAFENWQQNIQALAKRGVDQGLINELRQMGPKAGPQIAALNTLTDQQLQQYVALWRQKTADARAEASIQLEGQRQDLYNKLAEINMNAQVQLEQYRAEWAKKNEEIRKNMMDEMDKIEKRYKTMTENSTQYGINLMNNFISGIRSRFSALERTLFDMTRMVDAFMPHSPAKVGPLSRLDEWGPALVGTFADGITSSLPYLQRAVSRMAAIAPSTLQPALAGANGTSNYYGGNTIYISISGGSSVREQADDLIRELRRRGVRI